MYKLTLKFRIIGDNMNEKAQIRMTNLYPKYLVMRVVRRIMKDIGISINVKRIELVFYVISYPLFFKKEKK